MSVKSLSCYIFSFCVLWPTLHCSSAFGQGRNFDDVFNIPEEQENIDREIKNKEKAINLCNQKVNSDIEHLDKCKEAIGAELCSLSLISIEISYKKKHCNNYINVYSNNQKFYKLKEKLDSKRDLCRKTTKKEYLSRLSKSNINTILSACNQIVEAVTDNRYYSRDFEYYLLALNNIFRHLEKDKESIIFFQNLINKLRDNHKFNSYNYSRISYVSLGFIGDSYFRLNKYSDAKKSYSKCNEIYIKSINDSRYSFFISSSYPAGGYIDDNSIARAKSFSMINSRLSYLYYKSGEELKAQEHINKSIAHLEDESFRQVLRSDSLILQELGSLLYSTQQYIYVSRSKYNKALEVADRLRSLISFDSFVGRKRPKGFLDFNYKKIQKVSKDQQSTLVIYSIINLDFRSKKDIGNRVLYAWIINPNGEINFKIIDSSIIYQSLNVKSNLNWNQLKNIFIFIVSIFGIIFSIYFILKTNKSKLLIVVIAFIGSITTILQVFFNFSHSIYRGSNINQENWLSNITNSTLFSIQYRGNQKEDKFELNCQNDITCLEILYSYLISPIERFLPKNIDEHVVFIPHREIHNVPFSALKKKEEYLIDKHIIRISPSIYALDFLLQRDLNTHRVTEGYLIAGNPNMPKVSFGRYGKPQQVENLKEAQYEVEEIAKIYNTYALIGKNASVKNIKERINSAKIIHLATHGYLNVGTAKKASLVFSEDNSDDNNGILDTSYFYEQRMAAEMVVLSACQTSLGAESIEGNLGLTRPFLIGGIPTVISSLWSVPDRSTSDLMIDFHKNLNKTPDKAKALRDAIINTKSEYKDPLHWAGFILTGLSQTKSEQPNIVDNTQTIIGQMSCGNAFAGGDINLSSRDLVLATLESSAAGFIINLVEENGTQHRLNLDQSLVVQSAKSRNKDEKVWGNWNLTSYLHLSNPWNIEVNGDFKVNMMVSTRTTCEFKGKLNFLGDSKNKLFNN